jgi:hypothetical protein
VSILRINLLLLGFDVAEATVAGYMARRGRRLRLHATRSTCSGLTPEPIQLVSACPTMGYADERVHLSVNSDPNGLSTGGRGERGGGPLSASGPPFREV